MGDWSAAVKASATDKATMGISGFGMGMRRSLHPANELVVNFSAGRRRSPERQRGSGSRGSPCFQGKWFNDSALQKERLKSDHTSREDDPGVSRLKEIR